MKIEAVLTELLNARGPGGKEDEVRAICLRELRLFCDDTHIDPAGNVVGSFVVAALVAQRQPYALWPTSMRSR